MSLINNTNELHDEPMKDLLEQSKDVSNFDGSIIKRKLIDHVSQHEDQVLLEFLLHQLKNCRKETVGSITKKFPWLIKDEIEEKFNTHSTNVNDENNEEETHCNEQKSMDQNGDGTNARLSRSPQRQTSANREGERSPLRTAKEDYVDEFLAGPYKDEIPFVSDNSRRHAVLAPNRNMPLHKCTLKHEHQFLDKYFSTVQDAEVYAKRIDEYDHMTYYRAGGGDKHYIRMKCKTAGCPALLRISKTRPRDGMYWALSGCCFHSHPVEKEDYKRLVFDSGYDEAVTFNNKYKGTNSLL